METKSNQNKKNQITTDDLALSAYLKIKGFQLIQSDQKGSKNLFTFELNGNSVQQLKMDFVNSEFIKCFIQHKS